MRNLFIHLTQPGMALAEAVRFPNKNLVLAEAGVTLTEALIQDLKNNKVQTVAVEDSYRQLIDTENIAEAARQEGSALVQKIFSNNSMMYGDVSFYTHKILDESLKNHEVAVSLQAIRAFDSSLFKRAIQSSILGIALGKHCKLDFKDLKKLAVGLLLHDLGHLALPLDLLNKPGRLTPVEYKKVQSHVEIGVKMLKTMPTISAVSRVVVMQHHERYNGMGYPKSLKGEDIHLFGQIAAIADFYTALTTDRPYRKRYYPHEVLEYFMGNGNIHFSYPLIRKFLELIPAFAVGSVLLLSNGEEAVVVKVDMADPFHRIRPRIRLLDSQQELELAMHPALTVFKVLS